jgi:hypothetical protein
LKERHARFEILCAFEAETEREMLQTPRFNPEIGPGAIRGGCRECLALYQVVAARDQVVAALRQLEEVGEPYKLFPKQRMAKGVRGAR